MKGFENRTLVADSTTPLAAGRAGGFETEHRKGPWGEGSPESGRTSLVSG